jgi:hypothetical protein
MKLNRIKAVTWVSIGHVDFFGVIMDLDLLHTHINDSQNHLATLVDFLIYLSKKPL